MKGFFGVWRVEVGGVTKGGEVRELTGHTNGLGFLRSVKEGGSSAETEKGGGGANDLGER